MDASIYIATSQQANLFRDMDVTANNIANLNTTGYQAEKLSFNEYLLQGRQDQGRLRQPAVELPRHHGRRDALHQPAARTWPSAATPISRYRRHLARATPAPATSS